MVEPNDVSNEVGVPDGGAIRAEAIHLAHDAAPAGGEVSGHQSMIRQMARVFLQNKLAVASLIFIVVLIVMAVIVPLFTPSSYWSDYVINTTGSCWQGQPYGSLGNAQPSAHNILGCTGGLDNFSLLFYAARYSLAIGFLSAFITMTVGVAYGIFAGFRGGKIDTIMMRIIDVALSIPGLYLLILVVVLFGQTLTALTCVIGFTAWFGISRLMRSEAQVLREREYVQAATTMGSTKRRIMWRHILPNTMSVMVTAGTFALGDAVLALSSISYLGLGLKPPEFDWGSMIQNATTYFEQGYWWTLWPVGIILILFVLSTNYIGDALRDAFEVRLQER